LSAGTTTATGTTTLPTATLCGKFWSAEYKDDAGDNNE